MIEFNSQVEAAAFIAALSRFLNYPQGSRYRLRSDSITVWSQLTSTSTKVYLSSDAFNAVHAAFSPVPTTSAFNDEKLPDDCKLIFGGDQIPAWGLEEAQRHL